MNAVHQATAGTCRAAHRRCRPLFNGRGPRAVPPLGAQRLAVHSRSARKWPRRTLGAGAPNDGAASGLDADSDAGRCIVARAHRRAAARRDRYRSGGWPMGRAAVRDRRRRCAASRFAARRSRLGSGAGRRPAPRGRHAEPGTGT